MNGMVRRRLGQKWRMKSLIGNHVAKNGSFLKMIHRLFLGQTTVQSTLALHWSSGFTLALSVPVKNLKSVERLFKQRFFKTGEWSRQERATHLCFQKLSGETGRAWQAGLRSASTSILAPAAIVALVEPYRLAPWHRTDLQRMAVAMPSLYENTTNKGPIIQHAALQVIHNERLRQLGSRRDILSISRERQRIRAREQERTEAYSATLPNPTPVSTDEAGFIQRQTVSKMGMRRRETVYRSHCQVHTPSIVRHNIRQILTRMKMLCNPNGEKATMAPISSKYLFATLIADTPARFRRRMKNRLAKGYFEKRRQSQVFKRELVETSHEKQITVLHGEKKNSSRSDLSTTRTGLSLVTHEKRQALVPKEGLRSVTMRADRTMRGDRHTVQQDIRFVHKQDTSAFLAVKEMKQTLTPTPTCNTETTTAQSEAEVTSLVEKALRGWQKQMLNPKRLTRQTERSLTRQLLKERDRVGR